MRINKTLALGTVAASAVALLSIGSCAIPQPRFECNTLSPFVAVYTLAPGQDTTTPCAAYGADFLNTQRFLPPGETDMTKNRLALLPYRLGYQSGIGRYDPTDPNTARESAIGHFETLLPDENDVCKVVNIADSHQAYEDLTEELDDGGTEVVIPAGTYNYKWENVRIVSSAEYPGTLLDGTVTITEDACTAKYNVYAVHPVVPCMTDADCNPNADPANGRPVGSGMAAGYNPHCVMLNGTADEFSEYYGVNFSPSSDPDNPQYGVCFPGKTIDEL